jgi:hypothetical protein
MTDALQSKGVVPAASDAWLHDHHQHLVERLIERFPGRIKSAAHWLRRPSSRWLRIPAGVLLIAGSALAILPLFGIWMLPLGLLLLAEDITALKRLRNRVLDFMHRRWPHWFSTGRTSLTSDGAPPVAPIIS